MTDTGKSARIRYDEGCLAAHALNVVGDRWAMLVVREIMLSPKRFQMIRSGVPGITATVLTQRLGQLVAAGVVTHDPVPGLYALTDSGRDLMPVLQAMCRWGAAHPGHDPRRFISPSALMISMTAMITGAQGAIATAAFQIGAEAFCQHLTGDGILRVVACTDPQGDFILQGSGNSLAIAIYGPQPLADLASQGVIGLSGDMQAAQDFVGYFRLR